MTSLEVYIVYLKYVEDDGGSFVDILAVDKTPKYW